MKKLSLSTLAAALFATCVAVPVMAGPVAPATASGWSDQAAANAWSWAPIRDDATLNAHMQRDDHARAAQLPVFATIAAMTGGSLPEF